MSAKDIKELRSRTGAGVLDCKRALAESGGDLHKAVDWLRAKGAAKAAKKASRVATEGLVHAYIHAGGRIGVLIEVNCETDFVAMNQAFKGLVHDLAMHIAATGSEFVSREDVPAERVAREREVQTARVLEEGKPAQVAETIVEGRMGKFFQDICLLQQPFIKDDKKTVQQLLTEAIATIGENIRIRRFVRYELGEGLDKKQGDFAAEVAAAVNG